MEVIYKNKISMAENLGALIDTTESLMRKYGIPVRDTWYGYANPNNLDDYYCNKGYHGPKQVKVACLLYTSDAADE